ncbi:Ribosome-binding factor A (modular protein) [Desulfamplus magnetovallimortis]|uniref:Ribosome-binding factor A n=1 Tax=Desulfamplus magnetovallimortis TaxID=1246637 RepID=A0A1W1H8N4_9BACT|nr:30S ribosome-binding factor RbfA [Desulfamplus magnetovallimortis]SLM28850.1 Ribosome-binding factor A (modular protein) [Desulfamplus magnetovallimortis]
MKPYPRAERIGVAIQTALSELLSRKIQDPRIAMATISSVKVTPDLRVAYVYFAHFGGEKKVKDAMAGFRRSSGYIKKHITPKLGLKYMPDIRFVHDASFDYGSRIDALLNQVGGTKKKVPLGSSQTLLMRRSMLLTIMPMVLIAMPTLLTIMLMLLTIMLMLLMIILMFLMKNPLNNGIIAIDKPEGISSAAVVARVKKNWVSKRQGTQAHLILLPQALCCAG